MKVLVTGASRGIGNAVATRLLDHGHTVTLCASGPNEAFDRIRTGAHAERAHFAYGNLKESRTPGHLVALAARAMDGIDAVVANAGISRPGRIHELSIDKWDEVFDVNVKSNWLLAQASHAHLKASRGAFVAIGSISAIDPFPGMGAYSPSKAALAMLMRLLAQEWAADHITVNTVSPGLIHTAMTDAMYSDPGIGAARQALVPMQRIGKPEDLAPLVEFLISKDAKYMTGQNLAVDGGLLDSITSHIPGRPESSA